MPNKKTFLNVSDQNKAIIEEHIKYRASQKYLPPKSQLNIKNALKKLADYSYHHLQNKSIKNLTKEELIEFFFTRWETRYNRVKRYLCHAHN